MTDISTDQAHLDQDVAGLTTAIAAVITELKAQVGANPSAPVSSLDFSKLDALLASTQSEAAADAPPAPVVTDPAPVVDSPPAAADPIVS